ncbi:uncharacterized protein LOC127849637 [Dreissena polymorpha]|uniref:uncharacterized protein LOC127849637 n=1 Tax=Dreissena polymorpha TaxID=45954 RepID=UPI0022644ADA|nr:uncharacterized protein LOC127849637 [Dreissena polymorpha]
MVRVEEEISSAIKQLKYGNTAGLDSIPAEALKADVVTSVELLHPLFSKIWEEEEIPIEWKEVYLIKLPKKGDLSSCSNYRGITLLSIPGKVNNRILLNRIKDLMGTFKVRTGVRQGCLLSPFLFLLAIDWVRKTSTEQMRNGFQWTLWTQLEDLAFADDLTLFSHTQQQMQEKTNIVADNSARLGLTINRGKSKVFRTNASHNTPITVQGEELEEVDSCTYIDSILNNQG